MARCCDPSLRYVRQTAPIACIASKRNAHNAVDNLKRFQAPPPSSRHSFFSIAVSSVLHCRTKIWLIVVGHHLGASLHWMIHLLHCYRLLHKRFHKQPRAGAILRPSLDVHHRHRNSLAAGNTARRRHNQSQSIRADRAIRPCDVTAFCLVVWLFYQTLYYVCMHHCLQLFMAS